MNGTDVPSDLSSRLVEKPPPSFTMLATLYPPPRQITALPVSKMLTATTPIGPRKLWANGMTNVPMLYPARLSMANACVSLPLPRFIT